ncbi:MAG: energy transducer TonB [Solimicrobium sp.]|jgi:protein TonB|nr:energy transducer TonB [Solimicrobium sp.]
MLRHNLQNLTLIIALVTSLLVHAVVLMIHFVNPPSHSVPVDLGLDVILVNAKHDKPPVKAQALAQANLNGGGNANEGRATSPLPDMHYSEEGEAIRQTQLRIENLENVQRHLLSQANQKSSFQIAANLDKTKTNASKNLVNGESDTETSKAIKRMAAEIAQSIADENTRPHKTFITPSTKAVGYALYYKNMQKRIEDMGTMHFPQQNGQKLYGELIVYIPVFQDGTIYQKEGGPRIEKSSGNAALDAAALRIIERSAPFGRFPQHMRSSDREDLWIVITRFNFTRNADLKTELNGVN